MQADFSAPYEFEMLDRVGDVDLLAVDADLLQGAVEHLAGRSNEWSAGEIFLVAGLLADQHQGCLLRGLRRTRSGSHFSRAGRRGSRRLLGAAF